MTDATLKIRGAIPEDKEAIKALWDVVLRDAFAKQKPDRHHTPEDELDFKMRQLKDAFRDKNHHYLVAFQNGHRIKVKDALNLRTDSVPGHLTGR